MHYKTLINTCILSDLIFANRVTIDTNTLRKKFSMIFAKLSEFQIKLYESISTISKWYGEDEIQTELFNSKLQSLTPENIYDMLCIFEDYNLSKSAEDVLDSVWEISIPILHIVDTMYYRPKQEIIGDWRKFASSVYGYKPKTTQSPYIKDMIGSFFCLITNLLSFSLVLLA